MKNKCIKSDLTNTALWNYFKDGYVKSGKKIPIDRQTYTKVISEFNAEVNRQMVHEGRFFKIPYSLGIVGVVKRRIDLTKKDSIKFLRMDFGEFNRTGIRTLHINEHTDGCYFQFKWFKGDNAVARLYKYAPAFHLKRDLVATILSKKVIFREYIGKEIYIK